MIAYLASRWVWAFFLLVALSTNLVENKGIRSKKDTSAMDSSQNESALEEPLLRFGANLFKETLIDQDNIIFSPLSIHGALNMVLLGTKSHGEAEKELVEILGYSDMNPPVERVHEYYAKTIDQFKEMAAEIKKYELLDPQERQWSKPPAVLDMWMTALTKGPQKPLPEYLTQLQTFYRSSAHRVEETKNSTENEKLLKSINSWAKDAGFKQDVISQGDLEENFSVLLMSAVRVESHWMMEFYEYEVDDAFYNYGKKDQLVKKRNILRTSDVNGHLVEFTKKTERAPNSQHSKTKHPEIYNELADLEFRAIEIPLEGNVSMTILEPFEPAEGKGIINLEKALLPVDQNPKHPKLKKVFDILDSKEARVKFDSIEMPQFNFETELSLKSPLEKLGLKKMFTPGKSEITRMSQGDHYVSEVIHKAVIEVNKDGLKAAGITFIRAVGMSAHYVPQPIHLKIKNPYMFVIRYNKLPLFMGHLVHI